MTFPRTLLHYIYFPDNPSLPGLVLTVRMKFLRAFFYYPSINGIQVQLCLFSPLLPKVWVLQGDVCPVTCGNKAGLQKDSKVWVISRLSPFWQSVLSSLKNGGVYTLANVEPLPSDSMVMVCVRLWRIWSMSSSQNFEPSSSSSIRAP